MHNMTVHINVVNIHRAYPVALVFVMMIHCESRFDFWSHPDTDSDPPDPGHGCLALSLQ